MARSKKSYDKYARKAKMMAHYQMGPGGNPKRDAQLNKRIERNIRLSKPRRKR